MTEDAIQWTDPDTPAEVERPDPEALVAGLTAFEVHGIFGQNHGRYHHILAQDEADARRIYHGMFPGWDGAIFLVKQAPPEVTEKKRAERAAQYAEMLDAFDASQAAAKAAEEASA